LAWRGGADTAPYVFAGVSILKPGLFEGMTGEAFSLTKIFDKAMARNELSGLVLDGTWMHVGTPAALMEAERQLHEGERRTA
jgi:MurNAc alpha-1-phosphate uridylyltransferase